MFGKIKQDVNNILFDSYSDKSKFNKLFREFFNIVKLNESIREYYLTYSNIEEAKFDNVDDATQYLNESIEYLKSLDRDFTIVDNFILKYRTEKDYPKDIILDDIDMLIKTGKSNLIENKISSKKNIINNMLIKEDSISIDGSLPVKTYTGILAKKFNKKYENLTETEKNTIKTILSGNIDDMISYQESLIENTIKLTDDKINGLNDDDLRNKLKSVKLKLENYDKTNPKDSIIKIVKLKQDIETI